jgi:hypothetical protein
VKKTRQNKNLEPGSDSIGTDQALGGGAFDRYQSAPRRLWHRWFMAFYRFHVCDPVKRIDGHGHDGAALADDIDAMLFAAGIVQRLVQEYPSVPRNWAIRINQDSRQVGVLSFEAGLQVLLRPHWVCDQPSEAHEGWR